MASPDIKPTSSVYACCYEIDIKSAMWLKSGNEI